MQDLPPDQRATRKHRITPAPGQPPAPPPSGRRVPPPPPPARARPVQGPPRAWLVCSPFPAVPIRDGQEVSIGRKEGCNLVLPHSSVSRKHAVVRLEGASLVFEDLGSANGSELNGTPVKGTSALADGDVIKLGPFEINVRSSVEEEGSDLDKTSSIVPELGKGEALTGRLSEMPLTEVLQSLEFNAKSGTLKVYAPGGVGEIGVAAGRPLYASYKTHTDDEAVLELLNLTDGRFSLSPQLQAGNAPRMNTTFMSLLLEASRRSDEGPQAL